MIGSDNIAKLAGELSRKVAIRAGVPLTKGVMSDSFAVGMRADNVAEFTG